VSGTADEAPDSATAEEEVAWDDTGVTLADATGRAGEGDAEAAGADADMGGMFQGFSQSMHVEDGSSVVTAETEETEIAITSAAVASALEAATLPRPSPSSWNTPAPAKPSQERSAARTETTDADAVTSAIDAAISRSDFLSVPQNIFGQQVVQPVPDHGSIADTASSHEEHLDVKFSPPSSHATEIDGPVLVSRPNDYLPSTIYSSLNSKHAAAYANVDWQAIQAAQSLASLQAPWSFQVWSTAHPWQGVPNGARQPLTFGELRNLTPRLSAFQPEQPGLQQDEEMTPRLSQFMPVEAQRQQ